MEKERSTKILATIALIIAIIGVSVGFAAFTNNLRITNTNANVSPLNNMRVIFDDDTNNQNNISEVSYNLSRPTGDSSTNFTATNATIDNSVVTAPTITGMSANFIVPGESVQYEFYVYNDSDYDVELTSVAFGNKTCTPNSGTDNNLVNGNNGACGEIDVSISIGGGTGEPTIVTKTQNTSQSNTVTNHILKKGEYETVVATITYADLDGENVILNGDFSVTFGDITLTYSSTTS